MSERTDVAAAGSVDPLVQLAADVFEHSSEGIFVTAGDGAIVAVNRAFTRITGYTTAEVLGRNPTMLGSGHHDDDFFEGVRGCLAVNGAWRGEVISRRKSGELFAGWMTVAVVRDGAGTVVRYVAIFIDITAFKVADERMRYLAQHDFLTGLANRYLLEDRFDRALLRARRFGTAIALLAIDLDGFKRVNDSHGHAVGDQLLIQTAGRLQSCVRQTDTVARIGGDEFVVLLPDLQAVAESERVARQFLAVLAQKFVADGCEPRVTASIGIAGFPLHGADRPTLCRLADAAMYAIKRAGGNGFRCAQPPRPVDDPVWAPSAPPQGWIGASPRAPLGLALLGASVPSISVTPRGRTGAERIADLNSRSGEDA